MPALSINGARHYYRLEGRRDSPKRIVLAHSVGTDLSIWDGLVRDLLPTHQVLRYDIRGHGGSEATPGDYSLQMLADDLLALAGAVGWQRFAVGGLSIGGMSGCQAALVAPDRVEKLLLCSTAPKIALSADQWNARMEAVRRDGMAGFVDAMAERMFSAEYKCRGAAEIDMLATVFAGTDPGGYASCLAVLRDTDLEPTLPLIRVPVLLITGEGDAMIGEEAVASFAAGIRQLAHIRLGRGHYPLLEEAARFAVLAKEFLGAQPGNPRPA